MSQAFKKVLVANRGEIAMRIFRACHDLGLQTIAIYSNEDVYSLFRTAADESYLIGENESPLGAYLDIPRIIELAKKHGADAIHPGYGFLSENADFARACEAAGIKFIGPSSQVLDLMGDKLSAKQIAVACGVPTTPGTTEPLKSREAAQKLAMEFGFPVILKAAAGGGGRGMRRCDTVEEVGTNFDLVKAEAKKAFGNDDIFMEKFLVEPKHLEVQVLGDEEGNVVHLFERDCSLQRRYQKVVEFSPAFSVDKKIRQALYEDAVKIAKHLASQKKNVALLLCDMTAPMMPCICPPSELECDKSLGSIFAAQRISVNLIKHNLTTHKKLSYLTMLGLRKGENEYTHAACTKQQAEELIRGLREIAPYVVIDCSSYIANDILSAVALMEADSVLRLANCDLKSIGYLSSQLPLLRELHWDEDKQYKAASNIKPLQAADRIGQVLGSVAFQLPHSQELEEQYLEGTLLNDLSMKDSKAFRREIEKICKEVF